MSTVKHEQVREMLSAGEDSAELQRHIGRCKACRSYAQTLNEVTRMAPALYEDRTPDLADRVLSAVRVAAPAAAAAGTAEVGRSNVVRLVARRALVRGAVAAGIAAAVAAVAVLAPGGGSEPALVAAAKKTRDVRTARITLSSSFDYRPARPIELPATPVRNLGARIRRGLPAELRGLDDALARLPEAPRPRPIRRIASSVRARGEVVFPDRLHLRGTGTELDPVHGSVDGEFETIVIGDTTWIRTPLLGDKWLQLPLFGAEIRLDFNAGGLLEHIAGFEGAIRDAGEERLDGERVRRYRLQDERDFGSAIGRRTVTIEAWVGVGDGLLRRLIERHTGDSPAGRLETETRVRFHDFGADVSVQAPPRAQRTTMDQVVAGFFGYGFGLAGAGFRFSFEAAATMPEFVFPEIPFPDFKFELPQFELPDFDFDFDFDFGARFEGPSPFPMPSFEAEAGSAVD